MYALSSFLSITAVFKGTLICTLDWSTILGSIFVALLAGMGDFVLAGVASGTGILLTVGIVYRFYEEIAKTQQEAIGKLLGKMN